MLDIRDGRRRFLRVGALGLTGLSLGDLLRARAAGVSPREMSVIQIYLAGGPSHLETYDPKPDAPAEFRGEFRAIPTAVPGLAFGECFPEQAKVADRLAVLRSVHHTSADHSEGSHWVLTGHEPRQATPRTNERPSVGSVVARLKRGNRSGVPPYVALPDTPAFGHSGDLGPGFNPFPFPDVANGGTRVPGLEPPPGGSPERLADRRALLRRLDTFARRRDASGAADGLDRFTAEAFAMITGPAARAAFDVSRETAATRDRFGTTGIGRACLLARRLVEAGVSFVTIHEPGWDHHGQIFAGCRKQLPPLDRAVAALVADLHDRRLADRVLVLVWGEFGRTPRVNNAAGRDHWPNAFSAVLAGGGLRTGQAIGSTGRRGEAPVERPLRPEDVIQTVYAVLGIDPTTSYPNDSGRPVALLDGGSRIKELF